MKKNAVIGLAAAMVVTAGAGGVFAGYCFSGNHSEKTSAESRQDDSSAEVATLISCSNNTVRQETAAAKAAAVKTSIQRQAAIKAARTKAAADKAAGKARRAAERAAAEQAAAEKAAAEKAAAEQAAAEKAAEEQAAAEQAAAQEQARKEMCSDRIAEVIDQAKESGLFTQDELDSKIAELKDLYNMICSTQEDREMRADSISNILVDMIQKMAEAGVDYINM